MTRFPMSTLLLISVVVADFVHLVKDDTGVWWFEQNGQSFWSAVANHVNDGGQDDGVGGRERAVCLQSTNNTLCGDSLNFGGALGYAPYFNVTQDKYGSEDVWASTQISRLKSWGFNGISGWSARIAETSAAQAGLYYFHLLDIGVTWPHAWSNGLDWDVWSANFSAQAEAIAAKEVPPRANDTYLMAWQTDNEINWGAVGLSCYLNTYASGPGGAQAISWLQGRYSSLSSLNAAWGINAASWADVGAQVTSNPNLNKKAFNTDDGAWQAVVADRYFSVTTGAIRKYDSSHLISGVRFAVNSPAITLAAAKYCDLIDQHDYSDLPDMNWLGQIYNLTGKPVVLGEFSFTAADSNLPNTKGARAGHPCTTQTQRTRMYAAYAQTLITAPFVVGYGWWNFVDEPATGRWPDGEDSNYGLVSLADDPYSILTARMTAVHAAMSTWHAQGFAPCMDPGTNMTTVPLNVYYSASRGDHFVTTTDCYECYDEYELLGVIGSVYANCVPGAVALSTYWNADAQDNALAVTEPKLDGYGYVRVEGYAMPATGGGPPAGWTTLLSYLSTTVQPGPHPDYWAVTQGANAANATAQGYQNVGTLAYIISP